MNSGFYSSYAGFAARLDELEILANNLANANTVGFKSQKEFFRAYSNWLRNAPETPVNQAVNQFGVLGGAKLDFTQGNLETTGNDTDLALQGPGFFAIQTPNGIRYTRDGSFLLDKSRYLVTQDGDRVLSQQPNQRIKPIQIPAGKMSISSDGSVSVAGALVAKLRIEDFPAGTQLTPEGNTNFIAPAGTGKPPIDTAVRQGSLEASNSDPVRSAVALIDLQRTAQMMEKALSIFHNEFNRSAAQDLPRV